MWHAEVRTYLLSIVGNLIEAVAHHRERVHHDKIDLLSSVYFANWLAHEQDGANPDDSDIPDPPLDPEIVAELSVEARISEMASGC